MAYDVGKLSHYFSAISPMTNIGHRFEVIRCIGVMNLARSIVAVWHVGLIRGAKESELFRGVVYLEEAEQNAIWLTNLDRPDKTGVISRGTIAILQKKRGNS